MGARVLIKGNWYYELPSPHKIKNVVCWLHWHRTGKEGVLGSPPQVRFLPFFFPEE